ncbi:phenylalanine--tRNA ligase subunit beta, partial [Candidatus Saccharibacteria bacterium]|nr:phenylalanine--tRNA ligase subunit beta [Candidatus Saccharibacteria bacterium]
MRIPLNWLKKYVKITISDAELVTLIGARLVEVEEVIDETHKYDNIFIARVVSAEKIPDTHLTLCQLDVGDVELAKVEKNAEGLVQVVCGAPNVREGMLSAWIAPGAVVPASVHADAPFIIGKRKMLGKYESNGMLAGADELDIGDDHSGIVEIDPEMAAPGEAFADVFEMRDIILDIENKSLTHRPDTFGLIGFAREVAGIMGVKFDSAALEENIKKSNHAAPSKKQNAEMINIADSRLCARYSAVILEKHGELSKKYLSMEDTILAKCGMRPVDKVVDATNYLMLLTGQPLHAFDYDKFVKIGGGSSPKIGVRTARAGEKLTLLDGKEVELVDTDIVITSGDTPVALAGAMGGALTAIDKDTKNIMIESATFSLYNLRKTQMAHGIFSEAITRFTKGQPAYQTMSVALECAEMLSGGFKVAEVADAWPEREKPVTIKVDVDEINNLLGTDYDEKKIVRTLENVGFAVKARRGNLEVTAPEWRTDIHIKEDIIEEIGRLNGYETIPLVLPRHQTASESAMMRMKSDIRAAMKSVGANEVLTYSFVSEKLLKKAGVDSANSYKIVNSISPELQLVRQTLVPSLLEKAYINQKLPVDQFAIYEMNKIYRKEWGMDAEKVPVERMGMGFVLAERKGTGTAYYQAQKYVSELLKTFNIAPEYVAITADVQAEAKPFEIKRAANIMVNGEYVGVVGEFKNSVRRNFKLAEYLAGFELDLDKILTLAQKPVARTDFEVKEKE